MITDGWRGRKCFRFTLQWHLTLACDFHCQHCYDRSHRSELEWPQVRHAFREFMQFCESRRVQPWLTLTGGDPLLYPFFWDLYTLAIKMGVPVSILGNPLSEAQIKKFESIRQPFAFQVSLEGLESVNDSIRGRGHFSKTMEFLKITKKRGWKTHVMLTLSNDNINDVIPLADQLDGMVYRFTFNRLAPVGEGANMSLPSKKELEALLKNYINASVRFPFLGFKENLFGILRYRQGKQPFGGCTGFGCGAAFNFVALLPDGEIHACRKFPSLLGNILSQPFKKIIATPSARKYREGPKTCHKCFLFKHCRGCMAVIFGCGGNPLEGPDPHCFK